MKKILLLIVLVACFLVSPAQKKRNVYYLKYNGSKVADKDSADFFRIIEEPDPGSSLFNMIELYPGGQKKRMGKLSQFSPYVKFEGWFTSFHENGKRESIIYYEDDTPTDTAKYFFDNGMLAKTIVYSGSLPVSATERAVSPGLMRKLIFQADSSGHVMVNGGNGYIVTQGETFRDGVEQGAYVAGQKDGVWLGKIEKDRCTYTEKYDHGRFLSGESEINGVVRKFDRVEEAPQFPGGLEAFYRFVKKEVVYPPDAMQSKIKGKVHLSFFVDTAGRVDGVVVDQKLHPALDREAVRILKNSPAWEPGREHGLPVRVKYNIPLSFASGY